MAVNCAREVILVHSSDLHVDEDRAAMAHGGEGTAPLRAVLATARTLDADLVVLAGDAFDSNQLSGTLLERAAGLLAAARSPAARATVHREGRELAVTWSESPPSAFFSKPCSLVDALAGRPFSRTFLVPTTSGLHEKRRGQENETVSAAWCLCHLALASFCFAPP